VDLLARIEDFQTLKTHFLAYFEHRSIPRFILQSDFLIYPENLQDRQGRKPYHELMNTEKDLFRISVILPARAEKKLTIVIAGVLDGVESASTDRPLYESSTHPDALASPRKADGGCVTK
jgi:hypothetical protein